MRTRKLAPGLRKCNLGKYRYGKLMSKTELAKMCRVSEPYVSLIESGQRIPALDVAARIAAAVDATISQLWELEVDLSPLEKAPETKSFLPDSGHAALEAAATGRSADGRG